MPAQEIDAFRRRWAARIAADPLARRVIATLWRRRTQHVSPVLDQARTDSPILDPVIRGEPELMARHVADHFEALLTLPAGGARARTRAPLDFVVAHGVRRARGGVPLRAVLQAYRSGHKTFWAIMCREIDRLATSPGAGMRATMLLSDYCIEYTDLISVVVTEAYVGEEASLADARTRLSIAVMESLLRGDAPAQADGRALCAARGLADGRAMAVLVAVPVAGGSTFGAAGPPQVQDLAAALARVLDAAGCPALVEPRLGELVAIVGGATPAGALAARALRESRDTRLRAALQAVRLGVGLDVAAVAELPRSLDEARLALQLLGPQAPVAHLADLDVNAYLRHRADATAHRLAPALPPEVRGGLLAATLEAFAAADLNVKACARTLGVHTNTIYYRLNRVARLTGCDPRSFHALGQLVTALKLGPPAA
jgi:PucR C-terminal helix-turn-helix domain/GGDEF-like domain